MDRIRQRDLIDWRDKLVKARLSGIRLVQHGDKSVHYKSDGEMRDAIAAADAMIAEAGGKSPVTTILFSTSKGL